MTEQVVIGTVDHKGRTFDRFFAARNPIGPGWIVDGRHPDYGDSLIKTCASPNVPRRKARGYNGKVRIGWRLKGEAERVAALMNNGKLAAPKAWPSVWHVVGVSAP